MRYTVTLQMIEVIGAIWQPGVTCAMRYTLTPYDMENLGDATNRDNVQSWLDKNAGDFSHIEDFRADFTIDDKSVTHEWKSEESEMTYNDAMYPSED